MAKLTITEIENTKIIRSTLINAKWNILVSDNENNIYNVRFDGSETDSDETVLTKTHTALLDVEKHNTPVLPITIERDTIIGQTPKA